MAGPPVEVLRRALERAIDLARSGEAERPHIPAPRALVPVLGFRRLSDTALRTVARVLDTDDEFRARVAAAVDRDEVGRAAWLWLERPDGWRDQFASLVDELTLDDVAPEHERDTDKSLRRRLEGAERAAARASDEARRATAEAERIRRELDEVRGERAGHLQRIAELERLVAELTAQRGAAVADLKRRESLLARRTDEKRSLAARVDELEKALAGARGADGTPRGGDEVSPVRIDELRSAVAELRRRAAAFTDDLDTLQQSLGEESTSADSTRRRRPSRTRVPVPIPGGLTDDSVDTAIHLVTRPDAVLLVDGYNVSMVAWPDLDIAEQRARLMRLVEDLAARTAGLTVELVFDGADVPAAAWPASRRRGVTVRFTPPDVEADDELLELIRRYPNERPVVVVSNDRRVRDGARSRGANVLTSAQLLAVCGPR